MILALLSLAIAAIQGGGAAFLAWLALSGRDSKPLESWLLAGAMAGNCALFLSWGLEWWARHAPS